MRNTVSALAIVVLSLVMVTPAQAYADTSSDPGELYGRVIFLDPGHDEETGNYFDDYSEHITMLVLAGKIKSRLVELGATVHLTRYSDKRAPSEARCAYINKCALEAVKEARLHDADAADIGEIDRLIEIMRSIIIDPELGEQYMNSPYDPKRTIHPDMAKILEFENDKEIQNRFLFISLHSNAAATLAENSGENGANVFYISPMEDTDTLNYYENFSYSETSHDFGDLILEHIDRAGLSNMGSMAGNYFVIREHNIPGVLVENGHHTNPWDRAKLQDDIFLETLADAYADAITEYFSDLPLPARFTELADIVEEETEQEDDADAMNIEDKHEIKRMFLYSA